MWLAGLTSNLTQGNHHRILGEMTGYHPIFRNRTQHWELGAAAVVFLWMRTAGMKHAPAWWPPWIGHVTPQYDPLPLFSRVRYGHGRQQRTCVRVKWLGVGIRSRRRFHESSRIHHDYPVSDVADDGQIVRDEQIRQTATLAQIQQEVQDLCLNRHI